MKSKPWLIAGIVIGMVILVVGLIMVYPHTVRTSPSPRSSVASTTYTKELSIEASENLREIQKNLPTAKELRIETSENPNQPQTPAGARYRSCRYHCRTENHL